MASANARRVASAVSGTPPVRTISHPAAASVDATSTEFDSWIWPRRSGWPGGTSSSPVVSTTMRGRRAHGISVRPRPETADAANGDNWRPRSSTTSPARASAPAGRMCAPGSTGASAVTTSRSSTTRSSGITALAPSGTTPPVAIAAAVPGASGAGSSPARMCADSCHGDGVAASIAKPSIAELA